jgi:hypothetical protein
MQRRRRIGTHTQWLLLQEQEAGVDQLQKLGEVIELRKLVKSQQHAT